MVAAYVRHLTAMFLLFIISKGTLELLVFLALQEVEEIIIKVSLYDNAQSQVCFYLVKKQIVENSVHIISSRPLLLNVSSGSISVTSGPPGPPGPAGPPGQPGSFATSIEMRQYISDYLSKSVSGPKSQGHRLTGWQNRVLINFMCSMQVEVDRLVSLDHQVHLGLQEALGPSLGL